MFAIFSEKFSIFSLFDLARTYLAEYLLSFLLLLTCACTGGKNKTGIELIQDMMQQKSIKAQEGKAKESFMRLPPENTIARNRIYYSYKGKPDLAGKNLKNPLKNQFSALTIGTGKRQYDKACIYCHGVSGDGKGVVSSQMIIQPPSLLTDKVFNYSDGRIYHIIHEGQGLMGSYSKQVWSEAHRWALVNYVRMLQMKALQKKVEKRK